MNIDREKLMEVLMRYFEIGDSYTYQLTRVKEAFIIGTMTFDDFVEWDEDQVSDLCDYILKELSASEEAQKNEYVRRGDAIQAVSAGIKDV